MVSMTNKRELSRIHASRQRRRWVRRAWRYVTSLRPRLGIVAAYREFRTWLTEPRELP